MQPPHKSATTEDGCQNFPPKSTMCERKGTTAKCVGRADQSKCCTTILMLVLCCCLNLNKDCIELSPWSDNQHQQLVVDLIKFNIFYTTQHNSIFSESCCYLSSLFINWSFVRHIPSKVHSKLAFTDSHRWFWQIFLPDALLDKTLCFIQAGDLQKETQPMHLT